MALWSMLCVICLYHSTISYHHHCIHDNIEKPKLLISNVNYESSLKQAILNKQRRLGIQSNKYESIRIKPYWNQLDSTELPENKIITIKHIVSAAISYFQSFIKVKQATSPLKYPRHCIFGKTVHGPINHYLNCYEYNEVTQCGPADIPSSHLRNDWKYYNNTTINTKLYPSGAGLTNVDLVLYVTAHTLFCQNYTIAYAIPCVQDQTGRPIFSTINFCPTQSIGVQWKYDIITVIHELTHALGFSNSLYSSYINAKTGERLDYNKIISADTHIMNSYMTNKWIITPTVKSMAQLYFNCTNIIGVPLENNDVNSISSHWEEHFLNSEYMNEYSDDKNAYVSILTLALLEDTGWYHIDFDYADIQFQWGANEGCKFFENKCFNISDKTDGTSNFEEYFCNPNALNQNTICTADHISIGFCLQSLEVPMLPQYKYFGNNGCYGYHTSEYCPYVNSYIYNNTESIFNFECFDLDGNTLDTISSKHVPWIYSKSSRCINIIEITNNSTQTFKQSAFCFPIICNGYDERQQHWTSIDIVIANSTVNCLSKDVMKMKNVVSSGYQYAVQCPDIDRICINKKPFTCQRGSWSDKLNKCICKAGYIGDLCDTELKIFIDSIDEYNGTTSDIGNDNDLCALIIDNDNNNMTGTWKYMDYDSSDQPVYSYYVKRINNDNYYLYFDGWYHTWNIGTQLNDKYIQTTVNGTCDIAEQPYDVIQCSHLFYFPDDMHYLWKQNIYFILVHGSCENVSGDFGDFNASEWIVHTFYINTPSPIIATTVINESNETNSKDTKFHQNRTEIIFIILVGVIILTVLIICIVIYVYCRIGNKKLTKQLSDVIKQDLVNENDANDNNISQQTTTNIM